MATDIRAEMRARLTASATRWEGIVILKQSAGGSELQDARHVLHMLRCAIDILRSRAHRQYVTDAWLREVERRPSAEIARMIEPLVPGGYPDPPSGRYVPTVRPTASAGMPDDPWDLFP